MNSPFALPVLSGSENRLLDRLTLAASLTLMLVGLPLAPACASDQYKEETVQEVRVPDGKAVVSQPLRPEDRNRAWEQSRHAKKSKARQDQKPPRPKSSFEPASDSPMGRAAFITSMIALVSALLGLLVFGPLYLVSLVLALVAIILGVISIGRSEPGTQARTAIVIGVIILLTLIILLIVVAALI